MPIPSRHAPRPRRRRKGQAAVTGNTTATMRQPTRFHRQGLRQPGTREESLNPGYDHFLTPYERTTEPPELMDSEGFFF